MSSRPTELEMSFCDADWLTRSEADQTERFARAYLAPLVRDGLAPFFAESAATRALRIDGQLIPIVITGAEATTATATSATSTFIRYIQMPLQAIAEMGWNRAVSAAASASLQGLGGLLRAAKIDRCVYVGNWMVLRGCMPALSRDQVERVTKLLA